MFSKPYSEVGFTRLPKGTLKVVGSSEIAEQTMELPDNMAELAEPITLTERARAYFGESDEMSLSVIQEYDLICRYFQSTLSFPKEHDADAFFALASEAEAQLWSEAEHSTPHDLPTLAA